MEQTWQAPSFESLKYIPGEKSKFWFKNLFLRLSKCSLFYPMFSRCPNTFGFAIITCISIGT